MAMDIHKTRFEAVEICGIPALFTVERVRRSELPNGIFAYDMQTSEEDWSQPCLLACHITVEHYGTVLTGQRIDLPENGYRDLTADDFSWPCSTDRPTIAEFPAARPTYQAPLSRKDCPDPIEGTAPFRCCPRKHGIW